MSSTSQAADFLNGRQHDHDARVAEQERLNALARQVNAPDLEKAIRQSADAAHEPYPQYRGYWDGWKLGRMQRQLRTKGGVIEEGDFVLFYEVDLRPCPSDITVYSARRGVNVSVPRGWSYVEAL